MQLRPSEITQEVGYNRDMETKSNKWKVPTWCVVGAKVRIAKGKKHPIGLVGTVTNVSTTGSGAQARVLPDENSPVKLSFPFSTLVLGISVWCHNLEPV